jgi:hypothetical protein
MSADLLSLSGAEEPAPPANIAPLPEAPESLQTDALSKLLGNPLVLAGGAMLAGVALTRLLSTSPVRRLARDLADEALKRARTAGDGPPAPSVLDQLLESVRPQVTDAATRFLADILKKKGE